MRTMLILNHPQIAPLTLCYVASEEEVEKTLPNDFLILNCDNSANTLALARLLKENNTSYAAMPTSVYEALTLVNLNVRFLLTEDLEMAKTLQKLAETYLFDCKILLCVYDTAHRQSEIETAANFGIDGVLCL